MPFFKSNSSLRGVLAILCFAGIAQADVVVSVGYSDLSPGQPNPWYGSPATQFLGDSTTAMSSDPDEAAILLQNTGASAVILDPGFRIIFFGSTLQLWDSLIGANGISIPAGGNLILSGTTSSNMDLSEASFEGNPVVFFSLDGLPYSFTDSLQLLRGAPSSNESIPWTRIGSTGPSEVPEPGTTCLIAVPLFAIFARRSLLFRKLS